MMKLAISALALAAMTGSASAATVFSPPIPFQQFDGDCSGTIIYEGEVVSIEMLSEGSFCISDNIETADGTVVSYSKVDVVECVEDKIYEDWSTCDEGCANCEASYQAYTVWETTDVDNHIGYCFDYFFSLDEVATTRMNRSFNDVRQINFAFSEGANTADVKTYVEMMDMNSCINGGKPTVDISEEAPGTETGTEAGTEVTEDASGASTVAATAAVAMAAVTTFLLA